MAPFIRKKTICYLRSGATTTKQTFTPTCTFQFIIFRRLLLLLRFLLLVTLRAACVSSWKRTLLPLLLLLLLLARPSGIKRSGGRQTNYGRPFAY